MSASPITPVTPARTTTTRIEHPTTLTLVRIIWITYAVLAITLNILAIPQNKFQPDDCERTVCNQDPSTVNSVTIAQFNSVGLDINAYLVYYGILGLVVSFIMIGMGCVLFWQRSNDRMALLLSASWLGYAPASTLVAPFSVALIFATWMVFPTGRFQPRWTIILWLFMVINTFGLNLGFIESGTPLNILLANIAILGVIGSIIYRYRRLFNPVQRQQAKWFMAAIFTQTAIWFSGYLVFQPLFIALNNNLLLVGFKFVFMTVVTLVTLLQPIALWIAITRYRLFDLNFVINRSLVYSIVTTLLVVVFGLVFAGLQAILSGVMGSQQGVVAGAIAAAVPIVLFNPTQRFIQRQIDRRIFRLRYDLNEVAAAQKKPDIKNPGAFTGKVFGDYEALGVLGRGGMGEVYKGFGNNETVAIKLLLPDLAQQSDFRQRFEREAQTLARLNHPNIVKLKASGISDEVHFLAMDYIEGEELSTVVKRGAVTDYEALHDWLRDIAAALDYLHAQGLVHRDLKSSNIMLRPSHDGEILQAVVMDFGIARTDASGTRLTGGLDKVPIRRN